MSSVGYDNLYSSDHWVAYDPDVSTKAKNKEWEISGDVRYGGQVSFHLPLRKKYLSYNGEWVSAENGPSPNQDPSHYAGNIFWVIEKASEEATEKTDS